MSKENGLLVFYPANIESPLNGDLFSSLSCFSVSKGGPLSPQTHTEANVNLLSCHWFLFFLPGCSLPHLPGCILRLIVKQDEVSGRDMNALLMMKVASWNLLINFWTAELISCDFVFGLSDYYPQIQGDKYQQPKIPTQIDYYRLLVCHKELSWRLQLRAWLISNACDAFGRRKWQSALLTCLLILF